MVKYFQSPRLPAGRLPRRSVTLGVERLETRDCPASLPVITSMSAAPINDGHLVQIQGTLTDENPATVTVTLSGVATGSFHPNANGTFSYVTEASSLGSVTATAHDQVQQTTNSDSATITSYAPNLTLTLTRGQGHSVTLSGTVTDEVHGGRTVTFTGKVTGSTQTNANGTFSFTANASGGGHVHATTSDPWGQASNTGDVVAPPQIVDFIAIEESDNIWTIQGTVLDDNPEGMVITLGGLPSAVGTTVIVQSDGTFTITIHLQTGEHGTVTADTTNSGGIAADQALAIIN